MDLTNFVTYDKKESLLLSIAKSNQEIVENTHSKPQETLEFKMNKQKESFSFDVPLEMPEQWMMGVTSLEVYNSVYNITNKNNSFQIQLTDEQLDGIDTKLVMNIEYLHRTKQSNFVKTVYNLMDTSFKNKKKLLKNDLDKIKYIISQYKNEEWLNIDENTKSLVNTIQIPSFETIDLPIMNEKIEIKLQPGIYELTDLNTAIEQKLRYYNQANGEFKINGLSINIEADTISMKSVLTTSNPIYFNSKLNELLGFKDTNYIEGTHISEKPVMITTTDKVHLKCDCVDGSIVNGIREQILFSFNLSAPPGYKIIKEPNIILYKKINKTRLDSIQFFLEDNNHNPVDFNEETLTFTIQIIKIYYIYKPKVYKLKVCKLKVCAEEKMNIFFLINEL